MKPITLKTNRGIKTLTPESVGIFTEIKQEIPDAEIKVEDVVIEDFDDFIESTPRAVIVKSTDTTLFDFLDSLTIFLQTVIRIPEARPKTRKM